MPIGTPQTKNTNYVRPDVQRAEEVLAKTREKAKNAQAEKSLGSLAIGQFDNFIKILMTTLKNQDPNNPMDVTQLASQFAQFGQVAGLLEIKNLLESTKQTQNVTQLLETTRHTGREVEAASNRFHLDGKEPAKLNFYNPVPAMRANIVITDELNNPVHVIEMDTRDLSNPLKVGKNTLHWDGKVNQEKEAPVGNYKFRVTLFDKDNHMIRNNFNDNPLEIKTTVTGRISGGTIEHQETFVVMGGEAGVKLPVESIVSLQSKRDANSGPQITESGKPEASTDAIKGSESSADSHVVESVTERRTTEENLAGNRETNGTEQLAS